MPILSVRLPAGQDPSFTVQLMVSIRDSMLSTAHENLNTVIVRPDSSLLDQLTNNIDWMNALSTANQNLVGQIFTSVTQQLNQINSRMINETRSSESHQSSDTKMISRYPTFRGCTG